MERRHLLIAVGIVIVALAFLAWDPRLPVESETAPAATARIVDLGEEPARPTITTVELEATATAGQPDNMGAGSDLIARFEQERANLTWGRQAAALLVGRVEDVLTAHDGKLHTIECRATACRFTVEFESAASRPDGIADLLRALQESGIPALVERADRTRATLLAAP